MHKGRLYELALEYRTYSAEYPYPAWAPRSWTLGTANWAGTAAALVPSAPLVLAATGVDGSLRACYECPLFDLGSGVHAILTFKIELVSRTHVEGWIGGDWGINGNLPHSANYNIPQPFNPISKAFVSSGTAAEAYLRPTLLIGPQTPY